jgi:hypothetical protein
LFDRVLADETYETMNMKQMLIFLYRRYPAAIGNESLKGIDSLDLPVAHEQFTHLESFIGSASPNSPAANGYVLPLCFKSSPRSLLRIQMSFRFYRLKFKASSRYKEHFR